MYRPHSINCIISMHPNSYNNSRVLCHQKIVVPPRWFHASDTTFLSFCPCSCSRVYCIASSFTIKFQHSSWSDRQSFSRQLSNFPWMFSGKALVESGDVTLALQLLDLESANRVQVGSYSDTTSNTVGNATSTFQIASYCGNTSIIEGLRTRVV